MTPVIKPGAFLRRGVGGLSATAIVFLMEHKDELQTLYDGLDGRRDAALEAIAASDAKLAANEAATVALAADLATREAALAAVLAELEPREEAVERGKKVLFDFVDWCDANPLPPPMEY